MFFIVSLRFVLTIPKMFSYSLALINNYPNMFKIHAVNID